MLAAMVTYWTFVTPSLPWLVPHFRCCLPGVSLDSAQMNREIHSLPHKLGGAKTPRPSVAHKLLEAFQHIGNQRPRKIARESLDRRRALIEERGQICRRLVLLPEDVVLILKQNLAVAIGQRD